MNLKTSKGNKVVINFGAGKSATFTAGGRKRYLVQKVYDSASMGAIGCIMVNGIVRFADGSEAFAVLEIDESSSGEHGGTGVFLPDGTFVWQWDEKFCEAMGKTHDDVFPYKYKYTGTVKTPSDHHISSDGWSL